MIDIASLKKQAQASPTQAELQFYALVAIAEQLERIANTVIMIANRDLE